MANFFLKYFLRKTGKVEVSYWILLSKNGTIDGYAH